MRLCDTRGNTLQPPVGTAVTVSLGGGTGNRTRQVPGEIKRTTAQTIVVKYQPSGPAERAQRWISERFWKKNGRRVGDSDFLYGPTVGLHDNGDQS